MNNRKKSLKNLLYLILSQALTIAFGLLLPRMFVVSYGSEVNGLLNSLNQLLVYLSLFEAGVGTATLQALYKPMAREDWDGINGVLAATNEYYHKTGRWYLLSLTVLAVCYPLVVDSSLSYLTVFGAVFFSGLGNVVLFYFQGKYRFLLQADGKLYITTNLATVTTVLTSIAKIILIYLHANIVFILAFSFLLQCLQAAYILWYIRKYPRLDLNVPPNYAAISQKNSVLVHQISALIFRNTDVLILTMACGLRVVSVYSMFKLVTSHLESILGIPLSSINFVLGQTYQTDRPLYIRQIDLVESYYSAALYALFSVALFLFLPFMRLYTAGVTDINYIDPWLAVLFVLASLLDKSRTPMLCTIDYAGHFKNTLWQTILESAINLTVSLVGVYFLGIYGVLLGTVAALLYRTNDIILYANHKLLCRSAKRTYSIYLLNILLFVVTQVLFRWLFAGVPMDSYLSLILVGFASTCLSLCILIGGQSLLFPHCRAFIIQFLRSKAFRHS